MLRVIPSLPYSPSFSMALVNLTTCYK